MRSIRISRATVNAARLATHYENYQKVFNKVPYRPDGASFVPGVGDTAPSVVFVGEAPGEAEDRLMMPFVGRAGRLLNEMLVEAGIVNASGTGKIVDFYLTNLVKYKPPGNKLTHEVATPAYPMLRTEIQILNPLAVVPLGKWSAGTWFQNFSISQIAGNQYQKGGRMVMPMLHPSYLLRNTDPKLHRDYLTHFKELIAYVLSSKRSAAS